MDMSENSDYMIYLTEDHNLYGLGANLCGVLGRPVLEWEELNPSLNIAGTPELLMEDVIYAAAGRSSIVCLSGDNTAWWWGTFQSVTGTDHTGTMTSLEPKRMVEQSRFVACGPDFSAAIDENNDLWTWGNNVWGQCGSRYYACGIDLGSEQKSVSFQGDLHIDDSENQEDYTHFFSPDLLPVQLIE